MNRSRFAAGLGLAVAVALAALRDDVRGQQFIQQGFESRGPQWALGGSDAAFKETVHELTDKTSKGGQRSEHFGLQVGPGSYIHYTYEVGRAPVVDELSIRLWVKATVPGVQLLCRVVLPREPDPRNAGQPMTVLVKGDGYREVGRWQPLALREPVRRLREAERLLRAELKRDVVTADAYVDKVVLNVYGSRSQPPREPVPTDVWVDDLEVGPVLDVQPPAPAGERAAPARPASRGASAVQINGSVLTAGGDRFFPRIIRHTGTPPAVLAQAGFNTILLDETSPAGLVQDVARLGFWVIPSLSPPEYIDRRSGPVEGRLTALGESFARKVARFQEGDDRVLWYDLGTNLEEERFPAVKQFAQVLRAADPDRPVAADVWDGFPRYARNLDQLAVGVHRWPLGTTLEMTGYRDWLNQRRQLAQHAQPNPFCWTWVQTHQPDWFIRAAYDRSTGHSGAAGPEAGEPQGPLAEQIRLMAYTAVGCGFRGLGFWSDRSLADSQTGRDRLLAMALLNMELRLLEPLLVAGEEPHWIDTSIPEVKAAVIRTVDNKALLVLPLWIGSSAQYVPGQSAAARVNMVVPDVPRDGWAYEVSAGQVRTHKVQRVTGGHLLTLDEFGLAAAVVFTGDMNTVIRLQDGQRKFAHLAAQYAHDQAQEELAKVVKVEAELEQAVPAGRRLPDVAPLLKRSRDYLEQCAAHRKNGEYSEAYLDAQRALRPLRILMRSEWELAIHPKMLNTPAASPYAVSYFTLPRHWRFLTELAKRQGGPNALPDGDFELAPDKTSPNWLIEEVRSLDEVTTAARRTTDEHHGGKQCLKLEVAPKDKEAPPAVLERTYLAAHSPAVHLTPGTLVRVSAWVRVPKPLKATADGALFYDSAGGEPLAVRLTGPTDWRQFVLYRRVPESGAINVTMALTGLGAAYFDDVKIEPLLAKGASAGGADSRAAR